MVARKPKNQLAKPYQCKWQVARMSTTGVTDLAQICLGTFRPKEKLAD
jgi:hypothetical protein